MSFGIILPSIGAMTDTEFDAYWEEEARNPHRNRIRIGRQYQATIPPKLKSGKANNIHWTWLACRSIAILSMSKQMYVKWNKRQLSGHW